MSERQAGAVVSAAHADDGRAGAARGGAARDAARRNAVHSGAAHAGGAAGQGGETAADGPFALTVRVYYQHTDAGGVVYHANYLSFMEAARTELLHRYGFNLAELAGTSSVMFIVHRANLSFLRPARLHDVLTVTAVPAHVGRARLSFTQEVHSGSSRLVHARIDLACVDVQTWRPVAVPDRIRECMAALTQP